MIPDPLRVALEAEGFAIQEMEPGESCPRYEVEGPLHALEPDKKILSREDYRGSFFVSFSQFVADGATRKEAEENYYDSILYEAKRLKRVAGEDFQSNRNVAVFYASLGRPVPFFIGLIGSKYICSGHAGLVSCRERC